MILTRDNVSMLTEERLRDGIAQNYQDETHEDASP